MLDRRGARLVLCLAVLLTGTADMLLSLTNSLPMFYLLFCIARMNFAGPFDLGIYGAVNNWFVAHRALGHVDRHARADGGPGGTAADRPGRDPARRLARGLARGRRRRAGDRLHPELAADGAPAGGCGAGT